MVQRTDDCQVHDFLRKALERVDLALFEHVIGDFVGCVQFFAVNRLQIFQIGLGGLFLIGEIFVTDEIAKAISVAHVATEQSVERIALQAALVIGGK